MNRQNLEKANRLLKEIYQLMCYAPTIRDAFWRNIFHSVRAGDIDGAFLEVLARLDALGALHPELDRFLNDVVRDQIYKYHRELYKKRKHHLWNGYIYSMHDVRTFVYQSVPLYQMLIAKVRQVAEN